MNMLQSVVIERLKAQVSLLPQLVQPMYLDVPQEVAVKKYIHTVDTFNHNRCDGNAHSLLLTVKY